MADGSRADVETAVGSDPFAVRGFAQQACRLTGRRFTAMRLPYGIQADEADARDALAFVQHDDVVTADTGEAVDRTHQTVAPPGGCVDPAREDFVKALPVTP